MFHRIQMEGPVYNTRDLGGLKTIDGHTIKERCLLRSGALSKCTEKDIHTLTDQYNLKTVIDLRTDAENKEAPDPKIDGVQFIHNPILANHMLGVTREGEGQVGSLTDMIMGFMKIAGDNPKEMLGHIYPRMVTDDFCLKQLANFFELLLNEECAILWHCSAGKDRVGTTTALLLTALGVDRETIIEDYLYTTTCLKPETDAMIAEIATKVSDPKVAEIVGILNGTDRSYIDAVFKETEKEYGTTEKFLEEKLGVTPAKIKLLKDKFLE